MEQKAKYRLKEAAARIGIGYSTLRKLVRAKRIGVESHSRSLNFIYESEIRAYLKSKERSYLNNL